MINSETQNLWRTNNVQVQARLLHSYTSPTGHQSYVPFLVKANRFAVNKQQQLNPPIGLYNLPSCFDSKKSYLQERVNQFVIEAEKKKQQMSIFKSTLNRFQKISKEVPGPASYNLFNKNDQREEKARYSLCKQKKIIDLTKTCPSIPHKQNKYGYSINDGKIRTIQKNENIILREKISRKEYLATLQGEQTPMRNSYCQVSYVQGNEKKKLYQQTGKILETSSSPQNQLSKTLMVYKKPKYQHLYHSKGVQHPHSQQLLGPGSYEPNNHAFNSDNKKEKYQFFGSTQVRFKDKTNCLQKGYPLIQMIKDKRNGQIQGKAYPNLKKPAKISQKKVAYENSLPGPGQYNPNDEIFKKSRGNTFFQNSERFQGMYAKPEQIYDPIQNGETSYIDKKSPKNGKLQKQRFKPLQKVYHPVNSSQICGILCEQNKKKNNNSSQQINQDLQMENIKSWSRDGKRQNFGSSQYMRELKEQLAFINQTPRQFKDEQYNKKIKNQKND